MPTSADLFPGLFDAFSQTVAFTETTIQAVEKSLIGKNGKPYLKCLVRGSDVLAKAKSAVEIAIEENEATAMKHLSS